MGVPRPRLQKVPQVQKQPKIVQFRAFSFRRGFPEAVQRLLHLVADLRDLKHQKRQPDFRESLARGLGAPGHDKGEKGLSPEKHQKSSEIGLAGLKCLLKFTIQKTLFLQKVGKVEKVEEKGEKGEEPARVEKVAQIAQIRAGAEIVEFF